MKRRALASAAATVVVLLTSSLAAAGAPGDDGATLDQRRLGTTAAPAAAPTVTVRARTGDVQVQRVRVKWHGYKRKRVYQRSAVVPGIGNLSLICRPKATMVKLYAFDRTAETQMWLAKYETKNGVDVVATKNARIYTYDHADDNGRGGTGPTAHEGLNQFTPIEDFSTGYIDGVISQRPGRNRSGTRPDPPPVTAFKINWWWERFAYPVKDRFCKISAVLTTRLDASRGVNWHGDDDAPGHESQVTTVPGVGDLEVRCESDRGGAADGDRWITLTPPTSDASVDVSWISQEGPVDDHVESTWLGYDPATGQVGPLPLPRNGMMTLGYTVGGVRRDLIVSSYFITNNRKGPHRNLCEVAVGEL
ncbi:hypothetical protein [Nocardioides ferulae]|uniref:hypothetical protein n=1 Tax=Nocardioides ferulae TaxID=2340821 RepID=UPI000EB46523|nr:hypothetical protein [Nocardioides ferulae]